MSGAARSKCQNPSSKYDRFYLWILVAAVPLLFAGSATTKTSTSMPSAFYLGADISELSQLEQQGAVYMDGNKPVDALALFMKNGWTCFRLRIWVDPRNGVNGLDCTTKLARRIKDAGGTFMLDFHYSDWWADPQKQNKPAAWAKLDFDALVKQTETYSANVIKTLKDAGATPDFVQIGNEITGGTLWPDAQVKVPHSTVKVFSGDVVVITPPEPYDDAKQWDHLLRVLKAAGAGVRSVTTPADNVRIVVHIDCGGDWPVTKWYFDHLTRAEVDFDIIGQSYYPNWHGTIENLRDNLRETISRYHKDVMVVETAYPEKYGLKVEYEGPALSRQKIPDSALFRVNVAGTSGASNRVNGLNFQCSEALDEVLPDFSSLPVLKTGKVDNFDLRVIIRPDHIGLLFTGFLEIPRAGLYTFYATSDDGSRLFIGEPSLQLTVVGQSTLPKPQFLLVGQSMRRGEDGRWGEVEGRVTFINEEPDGLTLELSTETSRVHVEIADGSDLPAALLLNHRIRATGFCQSVHTLDGREILGALLVPSGHEIKLLDSPLRVTEDLMTNGAGLSLLVNAAEAHRLKREEAQRGYPVKLRGVITSVQPEHHAFTIQDSTRGIYVFDFSEDLSQLPRVGDYLEIEGVTDPSMFAPVVNVSHVRNLGIGDLPEPVRPTWDQLMNGSLDAQYVEIQGILSSVQPDGVILLTPDGRIKCDIRMVGLKTQDFTRYEDALIRVRGCLFATWDYVTHRVIAGEIRINGADITVDQPAPADLFSTPGKTASELLQFDPQASVFQRVKVSGQIINIRESECFMMDGNNGVRFVAKHPLDLNVGDLVDVVGFPEFSVASPILREAVVHKTGHAALPKARLLNTDDLVRTDQDSTRVRLKAILANQRNTSTGQALEMRVGLRSFLAWLPGSDEGIRAIPVGSLLELTGTYASQGVSKDVPSFELLLNSPSDDHVVDSRHRHELFLAFKEALTNIVRHSEATEVRLSIQVERGQVRFTIADNGRGWAGLDHMGGMDGVVNMRARLEKLGGRFEINSKAGEGTIVRFDLPFH